jgi:NADH-quinone oxidoreductase subunit J
VDPQTLLFYLFSAVTVVAALRVVTARNPVHAALFLVLTFFSAAAIWMLLRAEFLAITLVLVYVGAVMVLFLFVVMMVDINLDRMREGFWRHLPVAGFVGALIVLELAAVLWQQFSRVGQADAPRLPADYDNTKALGSLLYTEYVYPFEIAAVLLLVAIVAAIALTLRRRSGVKGQNPGQQVRVKASDRLRIVRMPSEAAPGTPAVQPGPQQESKS